MMRFGSILVASLVVMPAFAQTMSTPSQSLPSGLWMNAAELAITSDPDEAARLCMSDGFGFFPGGVWGNYSSWTGEDVGYGGLCQLAGDGHAACELMSTDFVVDALAPVSTPRADLFFTLGWQGELPETLELCIGEGCETLRSCLPALDALDADDPTFASLGEEVRMMLQGPIPVIEAEGIRIAKRAAKVGAVLIFDSHDTREPDR